jgi:CRP/FNR family cyclic AMP-dependent transcriptional regulator
MMNHDAPLDKFIKVYGKSEVVFEENSIGREMFVVCSGRVKLFTEPDNGRRTLLATLGPGQHFGEMALVDKSPRSATAVAAQDNTRLVVLDKAKFLYLVQQQPDFAFSVMETLCKRLRDTNSHLARIRSMQRRD